ncbi:lasso peptide biosynthesis PqqD family chaperone [Paenibacillus sp. JJ-223]|uniref:lasso peptide biosynthesis PqqD family chaperone n=1 Tax=Paenibacillus sp. JJ-223 TaxID=2905647 RepID=UPI001F39F9E2|nr:lasso peptide biosynthesis PqqD family chaperone [Paenibacillus sp. JJ-223]CAH1206593.1 hypothetical protein PAECIP111890_02771 [Paenibacillus sp. JJ-223]
MTAIKPLEEQDRITRKEGNLVSDMGGEKVMMSIQSGKYYNLGTTGGRIWELLSEERTVSGIVDVLSSEYEVDPQVCLSSVTAFLEHLSREGLIDVLPGE